jgi:chromosome segregation ATPase
MERQHKEQAVRLMELDAQLQAALAAKATGLSAKDVEVAKLIKENTQLQLAKSALETRVREMDEASRRDLAHAQALTRERDDLAAARAALETRAADLAARLKGKEEAELEYERRIASLEAQLIGYEEDNRKLRVANDALSVQTKKDAAEIERLRKLLAEQQGGQHSSDQRISSLEADLKACSSGRADDAQRLAELQAQLKNKDDALKVRVMW